LQVIAPNHPILKCWFVFPLFATSEARYFKFNRPTWWILASHRNGWTYRLYRLYQRRSNI